VTHVDPTRERFGAFKNLPQGEPVHMLNLVRLRDKAVYPDGRDATGRAAYQAYSRESGPVFRRLGGRQLWIGRPDVTLIGPEDERWDIAFIAEYPSGAAFIEMVRDPVYREAVKHRQAAVADSRLIRISREYPARDSGKKDNRIRVLNLRGAIVRSVTAPDVERSPPEKRNHAPHSPDERTRCAGGALAVSVG
jgi:uncharacterized protein (DUF1330 family)